ncbi:TBC1 domain family member 10B-like protein [Lates japonicus]|uniref:TBC1 domain family member 10B-like protein n=1 Tax=Lates japonicus TaxID=270547 RepID=A0AAD3ME83_LATJO|nr:TBC1 domain family member 10B-like protein [Lates japonicus]
MSIKDQGLEGKELKAPRTGVSTEGGEATAANWKWFDAMGEVIGQRPSITPPNLIISSMASTSAAVVSPQEQEGREPAKRKQESEFLTFLRELQEKEG